MTLMYLIKNMRTTIPVTAKEIQSKQSRPQVNICLLHTED